MNKIEQLALQFLLKELKSHPELASNFINDLVEKTKLDPVLKQELEAFITVFVPELIHLLP